MHLKRLLYLGLDPTNYKTTDLIIHLPLIQIVPYPLAYLKNILQQFSTYSHILITSKSTVSILIPYLDQLGFQKKDWEGKTIAAIGKATAKALASKGLPPHIIAREETAEGLITELAPLSLKQAHLFWPHSELTRPVIRNFLQQINIPFTECNLYTTQSLHPPSLPSLQDFDGLVFTSPSTVDAFLNFFGHLPQDKELIPIGPITDHYLKSKLA